MFRLTTFNGSEFLFQVVSFVMFFFCFLFLCTSIFKVVYVNVKDYVYSTEKGSNSALFRNTSLLTNKPGSNARFAKREKEIQ